MCGPSDSQCEAGSLTGWQAAGEHSRDAQGEAVTVRSSVEDPLFSVCVPVFNRAGTLPRLFRSVAAQGRADLELVVVDDGSTDSTWQWLISQEIVPAWCLTLIRQENRGSYCARARAYAHARGRWILSVDSDDTLMPGVLNTLHQLLDGDPEMDLLLFNAVDTRTHTLHVDYSWWRPGEPDPVGELRRRFLSSWVLNPVWLKMVRSDLVRRCPQVLAEGISIGDDRLQSAQWLTEVRHPRLVDRPFYAYDTSGTSLIRRAYSRRSFDELMEVQRLVRTLAFTWGIDRRHLDRGVVRDVLGAARRLGLSGWSRKDKRAELARLVSAPEYRSARRHLARRDLSPAEWALVMMVEARMSAAVTAGAHALDAVRAARARLRADAR